MKRKIIQLLSVLMIVTMILPTNIVEASFFFREQGSYLKNTPKTSEQLFNGLSKQDEAVKHFEQPKTDSGKQPISTTLISELPSKKAVRMIVETDKKLPVSKQKEIVKGVAEYGEPLTSTKGFTAYAKEEEIESILMNDEVAEVYVDKIVTGQGYTYKNLEFHGSESLWNERGLNGEGVSIAVLDTGVSPHPDIAKNLIAFKDIVKGRESAYDDNGHGTHIAGLISGSGELSNGLYKGMNPHTKIVGVKVLDEYEKGYMSDVIAGIDWVVSNKDKYNIKVINLSLGADGTTGNEPLEKAVQRAHDAGILVVAASGNSKKVLSPASYKNTLAVGSLNSLGTIDPMDDTVSSFSSKPTNISGERKPNIYAVGEDVVSTLSTTGKRASYDRLNIVDAYYYKMSGTSMAAPQVSAIAALIFAENPNMSSDEVFKKIEEEALQNGELKIAHAGTYFGQGYSKESVVEEIDEEELNLPESDNSDEGLENSVEDPEQEVVEEEVPDDEFDYPAYEGSGEESKVDSEVEGKSSEVGFFEGNTKRDPALNKPTVSKPVDIPKVKPYEVNNAYPFVEETYNKTNVLEKYLSNGKLYENQKEMEVEYEKVNDIVKLYNIINRSFTKEDFLYFEDRMNKPDKPKTLEEKRREAEEKRKQLDAKSKYSTLSNQYNGR